jgi:hypothetical protein
MLSLTGAELTMGDELHISHKTALARAPIRNCTATVIDAGTVVSSELTIEGEIRSEAVNKKSTIIFLSCLCLKKLYYIVCSESCTATYHMMSSHRTSAIE